MPDGLSVAPLRDKSGQRAPNASLATSPAVARRHAVALHCPATAPVAMDTSPPPAPPSCGCSYQSMPSLQSGPATTGVCDLEAAPDQQRCSGLKGWPEYWPFGVREGPASKKPESASASWAERRAHAAVQSAIMELLRFCGIGVTSLSGATVIAAPNRNAGREYKLAGRASRLTAAHRCAFEA